MAMNYDRRASGAVYPTVEEGITNAFQSWCLSVVLYGLRDDHDLALNNRAMKKEGRSFSIECFLRDSDGRADPFRRVSISFALNGDKIIAEAASAGQMAKPASKRWTFNSSMHFDDAAKTIAAFIATI